MSDIFSTVTTHLHAGLEKPLKLLQITDMHITLSDEQDDADTVKQQGDRRWVFRWGPSLLPPSEDLFDEWLRIAEREKTDCLLLTGDTIDAPSHGNIAYLGSRLAGREYLYITGNHDWVFPKDHPPVAAVRQTYVPLIEAVTGQAFDFVQKELGGLTLIGIDNGYGHITQEQYDRTFAALDAGRPVILCCHVPFYCETLMQPTIDYWRFVNPMGTPEDVCRTYGFKPFDQRTMAYTQKLKTYPNLLAILAGHIHFNHEDRFSPYTMQYTTQTAVHLPLADREGKEVPHEAGQARWILVD